MNKFLNQKIIITVILVCVLFNTLASYAQQINSSYKPNSKYLFHGKIELNEGGQYSTDEIFTGETETIKKGTEVKMTVSSVLSGGFSEEGDEFFAEITNDLDAQNGISLPAGTIAHGKVTTLSKSKRLGRDGYIQIDFDYLITPDGREIPVEASMTTKRNVAKSVGKVILEDTGIALAGGALGGLAALRIFGLGAAVSSNGYTVAGGAAVGGVLGAGYAIGRKGSEVLIKPGDEMKVKFNGALELPVMSEDAFKDKELQMKGLNVKITSYEVVNDPFGEPTTINISMNVDNRTNQTFSSFDMALISEYKTVYYPSPFGNTDLWFTKITPNSRTVGDLSFSVDNPKRKHWLVFFDTSTRKPLAKISLKNVQIALKKAKKSKKKK